MDLKFLAKALYYSRSSITAPPYPSDAYEYFSRDWGGQDVQEFWEEYAKQWLEDESNDIPTMLEKSLAKLMTRYERQTKALMERSNRDD